MKDPVNAGVPPAFLPPRRPMMNESIKGTAQHMNIYFAGSIRGGSADVSEGKALKTKAG
jgi:hypothetical protein